MGTSLTNIQINELLQNLVLAECVYVLSICFLSGLLSKFPLCLIERNARKFIFQLMDGISMVKTEDHRQKLLALIENRIIVSHARYILDNSVRIESELTRNKKHAKHLLY